MKSNIYTLPVIQGQLVSKEQIESEHMAAWATKGKEKDFSEGEINKPMIVPARIDLSEVRYYWTSQNLDPFGDGEFTVPITHLYGTTMVEFEKEDGAVSVYGVRSEDIDRLKGLDPERMSRVFESILDRRIREKEESRKEKQEEDEG